MEKWGSEFKRKIAVSYSNVVLFLILGALFGAHAKVAPILGPVSAGILQFVWFLTTQIWSLLASAFRRKPKEDAPATVPADNPLSDEPPKAP